MVLVNQGVRSGPLCLAVGGLLGSVLIVTNLGGLEKPDAHIKDWYKIWTAFKVVARERIQHNGHIAVEWPSGCDYWRYHIVQEFFEELQLEKIYVRQMRSRTP